MLIPNNPQMHNYGRNPYVGYDTATRPFLYTGSMPEGTSSLARVLVVPTAKAQAAVSLSLLREHKSVDVASITLFWRPGQASALDTAEIAKDELLEPFSHNGRRAVVN